MVFGPNISMHRRAVPEIVRWIALFVAIMVMVASACLAQIVEEAIVQGAAPLPTSSLASGPASRIAASLPQAKPDLVLDVGGRYTLAGEEIYRIAIGDSSVLDATPISSATVEVTGKAPGASSLYIWDKSGLKEVKVKVLRPQTELVELAMRMAGEIGMDTVAVRVMNGMLVLDGPVGSGEDLSRATTIASAMYPEAVNLLRIDPGAVPTTLAALRSALGSANVTIDKMPDGTFLVKGSVPNLQEGERISAVLSAWKKRNIQIAENIYVASRTVNQVMIRARVLEVNRSDLSNLGVDWGKIKFEQSTGGVITYTAEDQPWIIGQPHGGPFSLFGGAPIRRLDPIGARVQALLQNNKARILSEPNVLVAEGNEASVLVGGEIPIPIAQSTGGTSSVTIQWKQFGVNLKVTPTVGEDGKTLFMKLAPEVSSLDYGNAIIVSGFTLPALRTRRAETSVQVQDGESLVIGGLLQSDTTKNVKKIPLLGDIPILGAFFRTTNTTKTDTELVIIITPEILKPGAASEQPVVAQADTAPRSEKAGAE